MLRPFALDITLEVTNSRWTRSVVVAVTGAIKRMCGMRIGPNLIGNSYPSMKSRGSEFLFAAIYLRLLAFHPHCRLCYGP